MTISAPAESSLYVFPSDLLDEGAHIVEERTRALGITTLTLAMAYHQARDVTPRAGAKPRLRYRKDGVFFRPDESRWQSTPLRPRIQHQQELDVVQELLESAHNALRVESWTVFLHNTSLGEEHPRLASVTCFGDPLLSNICPLNPDVGEYATALARHQCTRPRHRRRGTQRPDVRPRTSPRTVLLTRRRPRRGHPRTVLLQQLRGSHRSPKRRRRTLGRSGPRPRPRHIRRRGPRARHSRNTR